MRKIVEVLIVVFFFVINPFGLKTATDEASVILISKLAAPFYPGSSPAGALRFDIGQDQIAVALMTDRAAEDIAGGYPVPLRDHGLTIAQILCAGAKAVFVDINFRWERSEGDVGRFYDALRYRLTGSGCRQLSPEALKAPEVAKVFIGHISSTTSPCDPFLVNENSTPATACAKRPGFLDIARLKEIATIIDIPEPLSDLRYDLGKAAIRRSTDADTRSADSLRNISPAWAMLRVYCGGGGDKPSICATIDRADREPHETVLTTRWGIDVSPRDPKLKRSLGGSCPFQQRVESVPGKVWNMTRNLGLDPTQIGEEGYCSYHDTMVASDIRLAADLGDEVAPHLAMSGNDALRKYFDQRMVFYGIQITGIADETRSPTLGRMPGVYAHAMALDNLITQDNKHWRDPPERLWWNAAEWLDLFLALSFIFFAWVVEEKNDEEFQRVALEKNDLHPPAILTFLWAVPLWLCNLYPRVRGRDPRPDFVVPGAPVGYEVRALVYRRQVCRNNAFKLISFVVVVSLMLGLHFGAHWPPNNWIVLFAVFLETRPSHRKYDEWTGHKHPWYRRSVDWLPALWRRWFKSSNADTTPAPHG